MSRNGARVGDLVVARYGRYDYAEGRVKTVNKDGTYRVLFQDHRCYGKVHDMRLSQQERSSRTIQVPVGLGGIHPLHCTPRPLKHLLSPSVDSVQTNVLSWPVPDDFLDKDEPFQGLVLLVTKCP